MCILRQIHFIVLLCNRKVCNTIATPHLPPHLEAPLEQPLTTHDTKVGNQSINVDSLSPDHASRAQNRSRAHKKSARPGSPGFQLFQRYIKRYIERCIYLISTRVYAGIYRRQVQPVQTGGLPVHEVQVHAGPEDTAPAGCIESEIG